jgi:hypothetical protein
MQTYNIPSKAVEGSRWVMGLKLENQGAIGADSKKKGREPGPGNYDGDYQNIVKK